ncbi:MAG TPA: sugar phosphate isomerase/epimerase, partial [Candidatus Choladousia intestinigallinarum]|nr:sugar phosphate isomerase/epimerase [Candidatus Choladousia intestinigallinarum]
LVKEYWPPILKLAQDLGVKIAIENCPMLFGADQWPGGQNLMTTPVVWDKIFEILPNDNLGINYDPSHFIWQMMDYIQPLYDFRDRLMHVHCKDIKLYPEKLRKVGTMAYPLEYMSPKIPGLGNVDWSKYISALMDIGYDGNICIEIEDRAFEGSQEKILDSLRLSRRYLKQFLA